TQSERCLMILRKGSKASADWSGWPVSGLRACRWTMAAPASAAPMAASAISSGVTGRAGDIEGVWMAPVTAQVMMTLRAVVDTPTGREEGSGVARLVLLVGGERREAPVAPLTARGDAGGIAGAVPRGENLLDLFRVAASRAGRVGREALVEACVAGAVIGDAAGRIQLDRLERADEGPAQAEPVLDGVIEVLRRDIAVLDETESLRQQRALQAVEDEAVDLLPDRDRHLADSLVDGAGAFHRLGRCPGRAAQLHH